MDQDYIAPTPEHFIPVRQRDLARMLCAELEGDKQAEFHDFARGIEHHFSHRHAVLLRDVHDAYAPFDPDTDVDFHWERSPEEMQTAADSLIDVFDRLARQANFTPLSREEIDASLAGTGLATSNLHVDFSIFDILKVYARGDRRMATTIRRWQRFYRAEEVAQPIYARLAVVFRLHEGVKPIRGEAGSGAIFMKLFQEIPQKEMRMLLPGAKHRLTLIDQGKIWLPTLSGAAITCLKIAKGAFMLAFAGLYGVLGLAGLVGGVVGYGLKSVFSYHQTKRRYELTLAQSLLYKSLDTNAGVLHRLLDESVEQECRETILAYYLLWQSGGPLSEEEIDTQAEAFLVEKLGFAVDFEADDALEKLVRLDLAEALPNKQYRAQPIAACNARLNEPSRPYLS